MFGRIQIANRNRLALNFAMALAIAFLRYLPAHAENASVTGIVKGESGQGVSGAIVKVTNAETGLGITVVSHAQGRYISPKLPPGTYRVQGFGGNYQSDLSRSIEIGSNRQAEQDVALNDLRKVSGPEKKITDADYARLMPPSEAKQIITTRCVLCHGLERIVPTRHTRAQWQKTIERMSGFISERTDIQKRINRGPLSNEEREMIVEYVIKNFGPDAARPSFPKEDTDPSRHFPRTLLKGKEANYVAMEMDPHSGGRTGGKERGAELEVEYEIGVDSQGTAWVSGVDNELFGHMDAKTLSFNRVALPPGKIPRALAQIGIDPEQNVWILDNGTTPDAELLQYDPRTQKIKTYEIPAPPKFRSPLNTLRFLDGNVWGTGNSSSRIVKLDPRTGKITDYHVPGGSHPYGLTIGAGKTIWYTGMYDNEVVKLDPDTGERTPYKVSTARAAIRRIDSDAEGNLWVGAQDSGKLYKLDPRTGKLAEFTPPTPDPGVYGVEVDKKKNLIWFTERDGDRIGRFDPITSTFVEFPLPTADTSSRRVVLDPSNPNRVWWGGKRIGYIEVLE